MKHALVSALFAMVSCVVFSADAVQPTEPLTPKTEDQAAMPVTQNPTVQITTTLGDITIELFQDKAPISVANFLAYVDDKFYDGTIFHRVIPNFMVQGGGFTADMAQKATKGQIKNEAANGLLNSRGTLAMARTAVVDSATSQFFINTVDNKFLDFKDKSSQGYGYAVFAKVVDGMDVVDKIGKVQTSNHGGHQNVPSAPVTLLKVTRLAPVSK